MEPDGAREDDLLSRSASLAGSRGASQGALVLAPWLPSGSLAPFWLPLAPYLASSGSLWLPLDPILISVFHIYYYYYYYYLLLLLETQSRNNGDLNSFDWYTV